METILCETGSPASRALILAIFPAFLVVLVLMAELAGRLPHTTPKYARKQVLVAEAGGSADVRDRLVRFDQ